jgi:hypothetical protein
MRHTCEAFGLVLVFFPNFDHGMLQPVVKLESRAIRPAAELLCFVRAFHQLRTVDILPQRVIIGPFKKHRRARFQ